MSGRPYTPVDVVLVGEGIVVFMVLFTPSNPHVGRCWSVLGTRMVWAREDPRHHVRSYTGRPPVARVLVSMVLFAPPSQYLLTPTVDALR